MFAVAEEFMTRDIGAMERGARLTLRLLIRGCISAREAATLTGVSLRQAQQDLSEISLVVPIYYDGKARCWLVCKEQMDEYGKVKE